ncbi:MAG: hypothetical protein OEV94_00615 [Deltaproteobacteria bacterium]|nr:hypothetical protein [Deltaproteobacteria bacterium]
MTLKGRQSKGKQIAGWAMVFALVFIIRAAGIGLVWWMGATERPAQRAVNPPTLEDPRVLTVAVTGGMMGRWERWAAVNSLLAALRREDPALLWVDLGDLLPAEPSSRPVFLQEVTRPEGIHLTAGVPGNLDWRAGDQLAAWSREGVPWVAANVADHQGDSPLPPYRVVEVKGLRVVVLGLTHPFSGLWNPTQTQGLSFTDMEAALRRWLPVIRRVEQPDLVVGLAHGGRVERQAALRHGLPLAEAKGLAAWPSPEGLDLLAVMGPPGVSPPLAALPVPVLSPGNGVAAAQIRFERDQGRWRVVGVKSFLLRPGHNTRNPSPEMSAAARHDWAAQRQRLARPTRAHWRVRPRSKRVLQACLGGLIHSTLMAQPFAGASTESLPVYSLLPAPQIGKWPKPFPKGQPLRRADIERWYPFPNRLVRAALNGRQGALLLEPWARVTRKLSPRRAEVLLPGGFSAGVRAGGIEVEGLTGSDGRPWGADQTAWVWMTLFSWQTGGNPAALLGHDAPREQSSTDPRDLLEQALNRPQDWGNDCGFLEETPNPQRKKQDQTVIDNPTDKTRR